MLSRHTVAMKHLATAVPSCKKMWNSDISMVSAVRLLQQLQGCLHCADICSPESCTPVASTNPVSSLAIFKTSKTAKTYIQKLSIPMVDQAMFLFRNMA